MLSFVKFNLSINTKGLIIFDMINSKKFLRVNYGSTVHGKEELKAVIKVINNSTQMGKNVQIKL